MNKAYNDRAAQVIYICEKPVVIPYKELGK